MNERNVVVMDGNVNHDWVGMFKGKTLRDGSTIRVVQGSWMETAITYYSEVRQTRSTSGEDSKLYKKFDCNLLMAPMNESQGKVKRPSTLVVQPDFVIARNQVRSLSRESDKRSVLYGLMCSGVPAINSLHSIYMNLERPVVYAALAEIERRVGHEAFPLISFNYYSGYKQMMISPDFPAVLKVSHAHRGMGKMKLDNQQQFHDISTIVALDDQYSTIEPFIDSVYGIRVQKIGGNYAVYRKDFTGSGWKSQFGGSSLKEIPLEDKYKLWADECSKLFGGLDILAVDALHGKDGKDYIIELNDTAIGLTPGYWELQTKLIVDIAIERMNDIYCDK
ncbi:synapsin [Acrasis kona]|uniref:Synapsin n=1 Tax=Acrasis kona TaxID=1008807 RepID=A0AAW2YL85_9EUKA